MQPFRNSSVLLELLTEYSYAYIKQRLPDQYNSFIYKREFNIVGLSSGYIYKKHKTFVIIYNILTPNIYVVHIELF